MATETDINASVWLHVAPKDLLYQSQRSLVNSSLSPLACTVLLTLVTGVPRCDHITPILQQLHWLPVRQRILFKITVLVFQCLAGQALSYLSDDFLPVSDSWPRRLRSSDSLTCVVRRAHDTYGDRCFAAAGLGSGTFCRLNCDS